MNRDEDREQFNQYLDKLTEDCWIRDGKLWSEQYTSHRFDVEIGSIDDPAKKVIVAACQLQTALAEQAQAERNARRIAKVDRLQKFLVDRLQVSLDGGQTAQLFDEMRYIGVER